MLVNKNNNKTNNDNKKIYHENWLRHCFFQIMIVIVTSFLKLCCRGAIVIIIRETKLQPITNDSHQEARLRARSYVICR